MVIAVCVTKREIVEMRLCKCRFDAHYALGRLYRLIVSIADKFEHLHDMGGILATDLLLVFVIGNIVVPVAEGKARLIDLEYVLGAVLLVDGDKSDEIRIEHFTHHFGYDSLKLAVRSHRVDPRHIRNHRRGAVGIQLDTVHGDIVKHSDFGLGPLDAAARSYLFDKPVNALRIGFGQLVERPETGILVAERVVCHPPSAGILVKIGSRSHGCVKIVKTQTARQPRFVAPAGCSGET